MPEARGIFAKAAIVALAALLPAACRSTGGDRASGGERPTLRVGVGGMSSGTEGLRTVAQLQTVENLARLTDDGRLQPWLARDWNLSADNRSLTVNLVSGVKFHDGSSLTAEIVANALKTTLPGTMGPAFADVESVEAASAQQIVIRLRQPSPFLLDALEVPVPKPGTTLVGTGPFMVDNPQSPTEMRANDAYYLGRPTIARIVVSNYPSARAAWADLLRGQLDMLYEVGVDALDSLEASSRIATFTFVRRYQYALVLNSESDVFRSKDVRRAMNVAIDREAIVRDGMNGHGVVSTGAVWPHNYAFSAQMPHFAYDVTHAAQLLENVPRAARVRQFTCLVRPDAVTERIALLLKRQLQAVGIEMVIEEIPLDKQIAAVRGGTFQASLMEIISGPTLLRPYQMWHSKGFFNTHLPTVDAALDRVRYAASTEDAKLAVGAFQQAMMDDPPAIFLSWIERARAVSSSFDVPAVEPGRDMLASLRMLKPTGVSPPAARN